MANYHAPSFNYYDEHAQQLFRQYHSVKFERVHSDWLHHLPEQTGLALDVGAGSGRDAKALADRGWQVMAVEPAERLRKLGQAHTATSDVTWLDDTLPELKSVRQLSQRFQLILASAVWMHLSLNEQQRALRILSSLLAPGGLLVITCREGPSYDDRQFQSVDLPTLDRWAHDLALLSLHTSNSKDQLEREGVTWQLRVFKLPDDGTGALPSLRHIIVNDDKSSTYKLGLLRALTRLADSAPGIVISRTEEWITVPLGAVGLYWLKLYRPLVLNHKLRQAPGNKGYSFAKDDFYHLKNFSPHDLRIGSSFHDQQTAAVIMRAIRDACQTIIKMPTKYTTWPGSQRPIFQGDIGRMPQRHTARLDSETLVAFGTFNIPTLLWDCMSRYACWLEPSIVHEWMQLMQSYDSNYELGQLYHALQWQEHQRDTKQVRQLVECRLQDPLPLPCVWSHQDLHRHAYAIDHCFPWARWNNNDLWNLLPTTKKANSAKSDRLPAAHLMQTSRQKILHWWHYLDDNVTTHTQFRNEISVSLPLVKQESSLETLFESALLQRQRLKINQQLAEWMGLT